MNENLLDLAGDEHWRRTLYASAAAQFLTMIGFSFIFPFLPLFLGTMGLEDAPALRRWSGIVISASGFSMAIFAPLWGAISDRYGRKIMVMRSMFGTSVVILLMGFATRPEHLLFLRLAQGALSGTIAANVALISGVAPVNRSGYALGLIYGSAHAGRVLGPAVGGFISQQWGYRPAFFAGAAFLLVAGVLVKLFTHDMPAYIRSREERTGLGFALFAIPAFTLAVATMFQIQFATNIAMPLFPLFVVALRGTEENAGLVTGVILSSSALASVAGSGVLGWLSDKWGRWRMLVTCAFLASGLLYLHGLARDVNDLFVLRVLLGLVTAGIQPSASALIRSIVGGRNVGRAFGLVQSVRAFGMGLGPLTGGLIAAHYAGVAGFRIPFKLTGVLLLLVPAALLLFRRSMIQADRNAIQKDVS